MSRHLPAISGQKLVRALVRAGFVERRQRGSHVSLEKRTPDGHWRTVVPLLREIRPGTLSDILKQTGLSKQDLRELLQSQDRCLQAAAADGNTPARPGSLGRMQGRSLPDFSNREIHEICELVWSFRVVRVARGFFSGVQHFRWSGLTSAATRSRNQFARACCLICGR